ncbi:hypothetical protein GCM10010512_34310 [Streptomyces thermoviolaceus subsp. thermoviolaceus]|nr:hypothetical protein GCM10010499_08800 [Streptomyces thermoviolaceus subsp. apingens]GHA99982.1 hypothetical protein GCM10010512_34310 [Streptomyces thermoviolaceus subsp. thermoviolaceus]
MYRAALGRRADRAGGGGCGNAVQAPAHPPCGINVRLRNENQALQDGRPAGTPDRGRVRSRMDVEEA